MVGHTETVRSLVEAGADVEQADAMGRTPLYAAAQEGHVVALRVLLKAGAKVSKAEKNPRAPTSRPEPLRRAMRTLMFSMDDG
jgi:ankyrin repeat protein